MCRPELLIKVTFMLFQHDTCSISLNICCGDVLTASACRFMLSIDSWAQTFLKLGLAPDFRFGWLVVFGLKDI